MGRAVTQESGPPGGDETNNDGTKHQEINGERMSGEEMNGEEMNGARDIVAVLKWVPFWNRGPDDGPPRLSARAGWSAADRRALAAAVALRHATGVGERATIVTVGPGSARASLLEAIAIGLDGGILVATREPESPTDPAAWLAIQPDSATVAHALAGVVAGIAATPPPADPPASVTGRAPLGPGRRDPTVGGPVGRPDLSDAASPRLWVLAGDVSFDRGSGAVPPLLAAELGAVFVSEVESLDPPLAIRRLSDGTAEYVRLADRCVLSFRPGPATLPRASLPRWRAARRATLPLSSLEAPWAAPPGDSPPRLAPYRRPAPLVTPPAGDAAHRIRELAGIPIRPTPADGAPGGDRFLRADPPTAAARLIEEVVAARRALSGREPTYRGDSRPRATLE